MGAGVLEVAKRGRPKTGAETVTVRIDRTLKRRADMIAGHRGVDLPTLLNELLAGPIDRAYLEMVRELERPKGGRP